MKLNADFHVLLKNLKLHAKKNRTVAVRKMSGYSLQGWDDGPGRPHQGTSRPRPGTSLFELVFMTEGAGHHITFGKIERLIVLFLLQYPVCRSSGQYGTFTILAMTCTTGILVMLCHILVSTPGEMSITNGMHPMRSFQRIAHILSMTS